MGMKNKQGFIVPLLIFVVVLLLLGTGLYVYSHPSATVSTYDATSNATSSVYQPENPTSSNLPSATTSTNSGIIGMVTISPACPGPTKNPPAPNCTDKAYSTKLGLYTKSGTFVRIIDVGSDGKFTVNVAPGEYEIRPTNTATYPRMSPQDVTVSAKSYTHVSIQFDSGMR